ncbi:MAG: hypothetical protein K2W82_08015 [Candidatus Obscuribacterales bacterium]|nr:hypothetical protein [Candidatus Obscuribacterales bacterium]
MRPINRFKNSNNSSASEKKIRIAIVEFNKRFPTEKDCLKELYRRIYGKKLLKCRYCGSDNIERLRRSRIAKCKSCYKKLWFTSGTFFNRIKLAKPWLIAIWLLEHQIVVSSSRLHKIAGIAQSSALSILKKLTTVIQSHMEEDTLIASAAFSSIFCKRSRETPARSHPQAEEDDENKEAEGEGSVGKGKGKEEEEDADDENDKVLTPQLKEEERQIFDLLSNEPISFDALCRLTQMTAGTMSAALTMLELKGAITRLPGERYIRFSTNQEEKPTIRKATTAAVAATIATTQQKRNITDETNKLVNDSIDFIRFNFHGISRKYLQNYLAAYNYSAVSPKRQPNSLLDLCLQFGQLQYIHILDYVTPPLVKLQPKMDSTTVE